MSYFVKLSFYNVNLTTEIYMSSRAIKAQVKERLTFLNKKFGTPTELTRETVESLRAMQALLERDTEQKSQTDYLQVKEAVEFVLTNLKFG